MTARVAVVIPIHNGLRYTLRCLESLERSSVPADEILVVDDGSTDGSAEAISARFPRVLVLPGDGTLWWSRAMNVGVREALSRGAQYVFSLNNDCIVGRESLASLLTCVRQCWPAVVCSKVRYWPDDGRILSAGGELNWWWRGARLRGSGELDRGQWDARASVGWLPGMGVLIPRACYEAVGLYDARRFPHYTGDIDFALRARRAGFRLVYEPRSLVWNDKGQTGLQVPERVRMGDVRALLTSRRSQFNVREVVPFFLTHSPPVALPFGLGSYYSVLIASLYRRSLRNGRRRA